MIFRFVLLHVWYSALVEVRVVPSAVVGGVSSVREGSLLRWWTLQVAGWSLVVVSQRCVASEAL